MNIKCLHPVVLINPKARKRALEFDRIYIKGRLVCSIIELFVLKELDYSPKKQGVSPDDVDTCYLVSSTSGETLPLYIVVPCGRCVLCRKRKANALAARAIAETETSGAAPLFITFTYNNFNLPTTSTGVQTLRRVDFQLFMKRLRSLLDSELIEHSLRYLCSGEYGSKTKRPHYHVLLWNFPVNSFSNMLEVQRFIQKAWSRFQLDDTGARIPYRDCCESCQYNHPKFADKCSLCARFCEGRPYRSKNKAIVYRRLSIGSIKVLPANCGAPAYITKYMVKGSNAPASECEPPFVCASNRNGGIGSAYVKAQRDFILSHPSLQALPIVDKVTGSGRTFYLPINSWVKNTIIPSPSTYLKTKDYETVREFVYTLRLFDDSVQQLYHLYPMDQYVDGELQYYKDSFCDWRTRKQWLEATGNCTEYLPTHITDYSLGRWMTNKDIFMEYIYTLTQRLDNLSRKVLDIDYDPAYFRAREQYLELRYEIFKKRFESAPPSNLEALAANIEASVERNRWKEYF